MTDQITSTDTVAPALIDLGVMSPVDVADKVRQAIIDAGLARDADHADRIILSAGDALTCGGNRAESRYGIDAGRNVWRDGASIGNGRDGVKTPTFSAIKKADDVAKAVAQASTSAIGALIILEALTPGSARTPEGARGDSADERLKAVSYGLGNKLKVR